MKCIRGLYSGKGFTLIELMVVVAILGILMAIALPSYQESVAKTRRADAKAVLMENAQSVERFFTQNNSYVNAAVTVPESPKDGASKFYDIAFVGANSVTTYTLQATPKGVMAADPCGSLTLTQAGAKGVSGGSRSVSQCW